MKILYLLENFPVWRNTSESAPEDTVILDLGQGSPNSLTANSKEDTESPRVAQGLDQDGPDFLLLCRPASAAGLNS